MIRKIITLVATVLPKSDKVSLIPYPDWEDMTLAVYDELVRLNGNRKIVWLVKHKTSGSFYREKAQNTLVVKRISLKGFYHMVTSKVIFCTHGTLFRWVPRGMKIINLWHGFGFKAVGTFLEGNNGHACTCTIASSEYSRKFFAIEMNQETDQVFPLGFPRNDRLIKAFGNRELITKNLGFDNFKKIIFWMPTYRTSTEGDIRKDGVQYNNPFNLEHFDIDLFYNYLTGNNFLCLFRAHPMSLKFDLGENSNFRITTDKWLFEHEVTLYQLLGITDLLISDVSSVITDYLLIDKPVIHAMSDFDEYVATRPLLLTPPRDFLVGPLVEDQQNLIGEIDKIVKGPDSFKEKRNELKVLFFDKNTDDKSTYRILKQFKI